MRPRRKRRSGSPLPDAVRRPAFLQRQGTNRAAHLCCKTDAGNPCFQKSSPSATGGICGSFAPLSRSLELASCLTQNVPPVLSVPTKQEARSATFMSGGSRLSCARPPALGLRPQQLCAMFHGCGRCPSRRRSPSGLCPGDGAAKRSPTTKYLDFVQIRYFDEGERGGSSAAKTTRGNIYRAVISV